MAISSQLLGSLGAGSITQSRFWFTSYDREAGQLRNSWNVPRGNYLFAWQGTLTSASGLRSKIFINGQVLTELPISSNDKSGGYIFLEDVTSIALTGEGNKAFEEDPYVAFVKIK